MCRNAFNTRKYEDTKKIICVFEMIYNLSYLYQRTFSEKKINIVNNKYQKTMLFLKVKTVVANITTV